MQKKPETLDDPVCLRRALLDFIADFANWDNSTDANYLTTARTLTEASALALGQQAGNHPTVIDPFAGGGAIPVEALRVGANVLASDLNPIAVLLNKVLVEFIPKFGEALADEVRKWGAIVSQRAEAELREFYPSDPQGRQPLTYLWARTIRCEGPGCGAEIPLLRSLWLAKRSGSGSVALRLTPQKSSLQIDFELVSNAKPSQVGQGTIRLGAVTCPLCGYTTPNSSVRRQLVKRKGGAADARLIAVVVRQLGQPGKEYRLPSTGDLLAVAAASRALQDRSAAGRLAIPDAIIPQERVWKNNPIRVHLYGMTDWSEPGR